MAIPVGPLLEFGITLINAWVMAAEQQGLSREEAIAQFPNVYNEFMTRSAKPVDPVKE